ncbi:aminotransferase class I/II-fold pyridoxal phosphate-dependent enzyme [Myxococcota bacterium]|nr:aminotransferase class I/II-fold pyridoxal phosphate-dependent enzyme [Myxococcota bacterium]MBU1381033.1 aminotransferase class I/II-fold pyridoxal phosphate-dependent enzyme [Myxococcota bacterium]MBU1496124.1 aminotransferase class I/II-fold pyridoxal phosphate-dependent enzyme [Myxococcota bacterium]
MYRFRSDLENAEYLVDINVPHLKHMMCLNESWENPWALLRHDLIRRIDGVNLNRYYDPVTAELKSSLASYFGHGITPANLAFGNGADEMLYFIFTAVRENKGNYALSLAPSYFDYTSYCTSVGLGVKYCDLNENFKFDPVKYIALSEDPECRLCILCNPNNPTGNLFPSEDLEYVLQNTHKPVLLDETYFEFSGVSFADKLSKYPNLIIVRSFSKAFASAGLRFGYMVSSEENIREISKTMTAFHSSLLIQCFALVMLENLDVFRKLVAMTIDGRDYILKSLLEIDGVKALETSTNFTPFRIGNRTKDLFEFLKTRDFAVRLVGNHPSFTEYLRVTPQSPAINRKFICTVKEFAG